MSTKKQNTYAGQGIEWLKERAEEIRKSVEDTPYSKIEDRIVSLMGPNGPSEKVVKDKESIEKATREAYKDYAALMEVIDKLEQIEEKKLLTRGDVEMSHLAKKFTGK